MFCFDHSKLLTESTEAWDWYYDSAIGGHLLNKQHLQVLQEDAKQRYLPRAKSRKHVIFIGPIGKQKEIHLGCNEVVDFGTAFELPKPKETKRGRPRKSAAPSENSLKFETGNPDAAGAALETVRTREGWLINFGAKIQCTAWAPNCSGTTQYLAVAVPLSKSQKAAECHVQWTGAPAFTPSPPYSTAIQIWSFEAKTTEEYPRQLNTSQKPRLRLVLCTEYGDVKRFAWCPMPRTPRAADTAQDVNLGLLAVIYGDGYLRVLDVKIQSNLTVTQWSMLTGPKSQCKKLTRSQ